MRNTDDSFTNRRADFYETAFVNEHAVRFQETAALTRRLEEQHSGYLLEVGKWKHRAVKRLRLLESAGSDAIDAAERIRELEVQCAGLRTRIDALMESNARESAQVRRMRASYSWRLTRPLRWLRDLCRRVTWS